MVSTKITVQSKALKEVTLPGRARKGSSEKVTWFRWKLDKELLGQQCIGQCDWSIDS